MLLFSSCWGLERSFKRIARHFEKCSRWELDEKINTTLTHDVHKRAAFLKIFYRRQSWACAFSLSFCFVLGFFFLFYSGGVCTFLVFCINTSLPHTGPPSRDQSPCLLCPRDTPSLCTWRWPASVPLLHHPLTVEGQGGPPLSTGPAAMRRGLMSGGGCGVGELG